MSRKRVLVPALALAVVGAGATPAAAGTVRIAVKDDFFAPRTRTVDKGARLKFVWRGENTHNVKATGAANKQSAFQESGTFAFKARRKGVIRLVCDVHDEMTGKITVR